jgi:SAM-dependent methyltransferase
VLRDDELREAVERDEARAVAEYERRATDPRLDRYYARVGNVVEAAALERRARVRRLLRTLGQPSELRVLDIGCGDGSDLLDLAASGWSTDHLAGVEIHTAALERARARLVGATLLQANAAELPFPSETFDAVMQTTVLSSVVDPTVRTAIADEMWRVTRRGGLLVSYDMRSAGKNPHLVGIERSELVRLFGSRGPVVVERITVPTRIASRVPAVVAAALKEFPWIRSHYLLHQTRT